ncbi:hypothetical protein BU17DRAFT_94783 [Hysterangium stoloniferum]|nr:hypothetical protein BU17DRAFT_94783 [Hysterangium stoloniferum]
MLSLLVIAVVSLASTHRSSAIATTSVTCTTDEWTFNEDNLSPCLVASALQATCSGGSMFLVPLPFSSFAHASSDWTIAPLDPGLQYAGPYVGQSNKCVCSTVVYSLVSACGACQGRGITTWSQWSLNCTASDITISQYPITIPPAISIPSWAYLNVTIPDVWDPTEARAAHDSGKPDSTAAPSATAPASTGPSSERSNHTGAIAGGVVGGVVVLALIAIGVFVLMRRRNTAPQTASSRGEKLYMAASPATFHAMASPPLSAQKLYDPSDPSTFPIHPSPTLPPYAPSTIASNSPSTYYHPQSPQPLLAYSNPGGRYSGAPEV